MGRGRQQKWVCKDCKSEFSVQGTAPKFCCSCGSENLGRAPSYELCVNFESKREELVAVCEELNQLHERYATLKERYDDVMSYWSTQKRRGYISVEEYDMLAAQFIGYTPKV